LKSIFAVVVRVGLCGLVGYFALGAACAQEAQSPPVGSAPRGTVLFDKDQDAAPVAQPAVKKPDTMAAQPIAEVSDAERASLIFTAYDLDAHLVPATSRIAVHSRFTVRNAGAAPLARLALQLSSSLNWESFSMRSAERVVPLTFVQQTLDTDADHTGKAQEAIVTLPQPLAPGASVELTAFYSGAIEQSAERLERIGAPADQAAHADWDAITAERTALRGFGNVLWYPTAAAPVFLGDGAKLFQIVGQTKLLQAPATVHLRLAVEYVGDPPDTAFFCGRRERLVAVSENANVVVAESPGVATAEFSERPLGFRAMSLFVTDRAATTTDGELISAVTDHYDALPNYAAAALKVQPLLKDWLGADPLTPLNILDQDGQPFEDDALLVTTLRANEASVLAPSLVHSLTHAWFRSSHVWLDEGMAQFMSLLWVEQSQGRDAALQQLQQQVNTLSLAEPALPQGGDAAQVGQSLIGARDEVYYRTKAAAVLWMLRSLVGDDALKNALQLYRRDEKGDVDPKQFQRVVEHASKKDLAWFFNDWVYRDRGLADLSIVSVTPRALPTKADKGESWLIAVEVRNDGDAAVEVPVTVRSGTLTATQSLRILGRSSASTRIVFEGEPTEVMVNDGSSPEMTTPTHIKEVVVR
jgi:Peptidase family M1 domain